MYPNQTDVNVNTFLYRVVMGCTRFPRRLMEVGITREKLDIRLDHLIVGLLERTGFM